MSTKIVPSVILIRPQMGENIGAVARAMSNFGLCDLRLVAPRDGWPNPKAVDMAAGAEHIIQHAQVYDAVASAMHGIHTAYATTARIRELEKRVLEPKAAIIEMKTICAGGQQTALVFGPERAGMTNDDLLWCEALITIPTASENPSLNIAQSAVLLGYEWFCQQNTASFARALPEAASKLEWQEMFGQLENYLDEAQYFRVAEKKPLMWRNVQNMLLRAQLNPQELRTLRGMLRSLWEKDKGKRQD